MLRPRPSSSLPARPASLRGPKFGTIAEAATAPAATSAPSGEIDSSVKPAEPSTRPRGRPGRETAGRLANPPTRRWLRWCGRRTSGGTSPAPQGEPAEEKPNNRPPTQRDRTRRSARGDRARATGRTGQRPGSNRRAFRNHRPAPAAAEANPAEPATAAAPDECGHDQNHFALRRSLARRRRNLMLLRLQPAARFPPPARPRPPTMPRPPLITRQRLRQRPQLIRQQRLRQCPHRSSPMPIRRSPHNCANSPMASSTVWSAARKAAGFRRLLRRPRLRADLDHRRQIQRARGGGDRLPRAGRCRRPRSGRLSGAEHLPRRQRSRCIGGSRNAALRLGRDLRASCFGRTRAWSRVSSSILYEVKPPAPADCSRRQWLTPRMWPRRSQATSRRRRTISRSRPSSPICAPAKPSRQGADPERAGAQDRRTGRPRAATARAVRTERRRHDLRQAARRRGEEVPSRSMSSR